MKDPETTKLNEDGFIKKSLEAFSPPVWLNNPDPVVPEPPTPLENTGAEGTTEPSTTSPDASL